MSALGQGITRNWTGADSANWSDPNNWSPAGLPASGDTLQFGEVSDNHRTMQNDLSGVQVTNLFFSHNNYTVNGNAIVTAEVYNSADGYTDNGSFTTTINCPLIFAGYGGQIYSEAPNGTFTQSTLTLHLNGPITIGIRGLSIFADAYADNEDIGGGNSHIFLSGPISGSGNLSAWANTDIYGLNYSSIQFDGTEGNTFAGTLFPTAAGGALIIFDKSSGFVVTNSLAIEGDYLCDVQLAGANQIGNNANIIFYDGGHLDFLGNNNLTIGSIVFTNLDGEETNDCTLDTGSITVGLNGGISAASWEAGTIPTIKGKINFNGALPVEVDGSSTPGLDIQAVIEGAGFNKMGNNSLQLDANNTFYGNLEISAGYVVPTNAAALSPSASAGVILNGGTLSLTGLAINTDPLFVDSSNSTLITHGTCSWGGPVTLNQTLNLIPEDTTLAGLVTTFSGAITGSGGMTLEPVFLAAGNVEFSGSSANTFSGPLTVQCHNLYLDKPAYTEAFGGPLIVGSGPGPVCQVSWLNNYQGLNEGPVAVYTNGIVDLNGYNDNFGPVTYNGGTIETFSGSLSLFGTVTVNPAGQTAILSGNATLPPGNPVEFNVPQGYTGTGLELSCQAALSGSAPSLVKQGSGTLSLAGPNSSQASTLVQQGILDVDNASALGTAPVVVSGGATLRFDVGATLGQSFELAGDGLNGTLGAVDDLVSNVAVILNGPILLDAETTFNIGQGGFLFIDGAVSGTGPFTEAGPGAISLGGTSANTYTGGTFVNQGLLDLGKSGGLTAAPGNLSIGTITRFHHNGTTATVLCFQDNPISGTNVIVNGGSLLNLNDQNQTLQSVTLNSGGSINTESGTLTLNGGNGTMVVGVNPDSSGSVIAGNLLLPTGGNFTVNGYTGALLGAAAPELDVPAVVSDTLPEFIEKDGAGQMRFSAPNTFNSAVTVNGGTLTVINSSGLGTTSFGASVNNGAVLAVSNNVTIGKFLSLNSTNASGALQSLGGSNVLTGGINLSQTANISINPATGYLDLPCAIAGPGGLTSGGLGTLQLEGTNANTYAGLTTVGSGVLEAARYAIEIRRHIAVGGGYYYTTNKVSQICIPGDVVIGSDAPGSLPAALQIDYLQQFPATANIADHLSGSLNLVYLGAGQLQPAIDTIQSLTGSGQVNLVLNSALYIQNPSPFTFYGSVNGDGAFGLIGPGTMTTWGNFNTTGSVSVGGGDWEFFGARHNGGIAVGGGARLGGDGEVEGAVSLSSATLGVDTPPGTVHQQGSIFLVGSLTNAAGATIQLDMFGPTPNGGNDQIITASGGVSLFGDTFLSTSFSYPPRSGDVIDLIHVAPGQTISGTFSNFTDGVVTLVGQTPVLPGYHGGAGHDFTLTVTNLALAYVGYQLAEGNGNQTVEPDECNLLYVSLVNRRTSPLTITNAYLLATTAPGVVVTVPVATYPVIAAGQTGTNSTPFQFKTDTNLPCGGAVAFELVLGVVNEGQFAIDFSPVSGSDCSHPTGPCESCTVVSGQFTTNTPTASPLYFVGAPSICYPPKAYQGTNPIPPATPSPYLTHNFTNNTTNTLCITAELDFACPAAPMNALGVAAYLGAFDPNHPSVGYLGDIGQGGPPYPPFAFQVPAGTNFTVVVMAQATNLPCSDYTLQLFGLPCPPPALAIQPEPAGTNHVRLDWSTAYPGFIAQQSGDLKGEIFNNLIQSPVILSSRYALTNLPAITNQFYRLKK